MPRLDVAQHSCRAQAFQAVTRLAPMQQQDRPQTFELDEPVLCIGGRLKVRRLHHLLGSERLTDGAQLPLLAALLQV